MLDIYRACAKWVVVLLVEGETNFVFPNWGSISYALLCRSTYFEVNLPSDLDIPQGCEDGTVAILDKRALSVPVSVQVNKYPVRYLVCLSSRK